MKEIQLTRGKVALVDDEDWFMLNLFKWQCTKGGYASTSTLDNLVPKINNRSKVLGVFMHRFVMKLDNFSLLIVDHIDGNRLNNQKSNLRICEKRLNTCNAHKTKTKLTTSKYKGVYKKSNRWISEINPNNKKMCLGRFPYTPEGEIQAAKAYDKKAKELWGEFAKPNFQ